MLFITAIIIKNLFLHVPQLMECGLTGEHGHPVARPVAMEQEAVRVLVTIPLQLMMAHPVKVTQVTRDRASKIIVQVSLIQLLQNKNK